MAERASTAAPASRRGSRRFVSSGNVEPLTAARAEPPGVKALFCSGYTAGPLVTGDAALGSGRAFIEKPFGGRELTEKVRALLDRRG